MQQILRLFSGDALRARALRGSALTIVNFGMANVLRLGSNLILTRILFPEAFGLMALVQVFMVGLQMFSDIGIQTSVIRSERGDDPRFLHTAWTVQAGRGVLLWLGSVALALPVAVFYDQPELQALLPVVGLNAILLGVASINIYTVNRKMMLGRLTVLEIGSQVIGIIAMILLALWWESVWALVVGGLITTAVKAIGSHLILPGEKAGFAMDMPAFWEIFHFGKWIFLSTLAGFLVRHGDKAILGKYIPIGDLALYHIAMLLAMVPTTLNGALMTRILFPLYVKRPPAESSANRHKIYKVRMLLTGGTFLLSLPMVLFGTEIIEFLYDPRYYGAGPILIGLTFALLFQIITAGHGQVLLANGESMIFAALMISSALIRVGLMLVGASNYGIPGVIGGAILGELLLYPFLVWLVARRKAWSASHDLLFAALAVAAIAGALWLKPGIWPEFIALAQSNSGG